MKKCAAFMLLFLMAASLPAQTNRPIKLALIAETTEAADAVDVLTAQLSGDNQIQLLERDEIEKVYHEQGISAGNRNDVQLGRVLGADGLLLVNIVTGPQTPGPAAVFGSSQEKENLTIRLVAVKPGVILSDVSYTLRQADLTQWAQSAAPYLDSFLPKLTVSAGEAIPLSIVNLRSAVQSADELETEHQLKLLAIERLSREPRFFVLEREKMQLLEEEKNLSADESAFWDGNYLLDGTVDQNGYSKDTITINARLTPPKGAAPLVFEVSGSRTNLAEVINALATNVTRLLNIQPTIKEWSAADEAAQYFDEAKWAVKWGVFSEAEAAADSAWALGKRDLDCALVRVNAYIMETRCEFVPLQDGVFSLSPGQSPSIWDEDMADISKTNAGAAFEKRLGEIDYSTMTERPNPRGIETAIHALELYYEFSRNSTNGQPVADSDWYKLGIEDLIAASKILQDFNLAPQAQTGVEDELADLRSMARSVASLICECPSVHESYFGPDAALPSDEFVGTIYEKPNIFVCELNWGCFWQETPRDEITLYQNLMDSGVFAQMHEDFWFRSPGQPRLVAWNDADRQNLETARNQFLQEMGASSNPLMRVEGKAIQLRDAASYDEAAAAIANFFETLIACRCALITNHIDWEFNNLTEAFYGSKSTASGSVEYAESAQRDALLKLCAAYSDRLSAEDGRAAKILEEQKNSDVFEKQKQYLANLTPYDFFGFTKVFEERNYTKAQAAELLPLIENYKSNLIAQASGPRKFKANADAQFIDFILGGDVRQALNPPAAPTANAANVVRQSVRPPPPAKAALANNTGPALAIPTNILQVTDFIKIPEEKDPNDVTANQIFAQRWSEGKLLLGLVHDKNLYDYDTNGNWVDTRIVSLDKIAIFNPANEAWTFVNGSEVPDGGMMQMLQKENNRLLLFNGRLFSSVDGPVKTFDFQRRQWQTLNSLGQDGCDLYSVAGRLYAVNADTILELTEDGNARILASTRRRPAITALDSLDSFAPQPFRIFPQLFAGADQSLCASIGNKVYRRDGNDWHEMRAVDISQPPEIFDRALIFRAIGGYGSDDPANLWVWDKSQSPPELYLSEKPMPHPGVINSPFRKHTPQHLHPHWESLPDDYLTRATATFCGSNLYFFVEHVDVKNINGRWTVREKDGYHAKLVCLKPDLPQPKVVPLRFDTSRGTAPINPESWAPGAEATTMNFSGNTLYLSQRNALGIWAIPLSQIESAIAAQRNNAKADTLAAQLLSKDSAP